MGPLPVRPSGSLSMPGTVKDPETFRSSWEAGFGGSHRANKVAILDNMKRPHICSNVDSPYTMVVSQHSRMVYHIQKEVTNE
jgi:hypothetical protein